MADNNNSINSNTIKEGEVLKANNNNMSDRHLNMFHPPRAVVGAGSGEMMGPILRRKKVVSLPLGHGGDFFVTTDFCGPRRQLFDHHPVGAVTTGGGGDAAGAEMAGAAPKAAPSSTAANSSTRVRQNSHPTRIRQITPTGGTTSTSPHHHQHRRQRFKQDSLMRNIIRRKQVSLDLLGANDFFATDHTVLEDEAFDGGITGVEPIAAGGADHITEGIHEGKELHEEEEDEEEAHKKDDKEARINQAEEDIDEESKLFMPLRFAPRVVMTGRKGGHGGGHGGGGPTATAASTPTIDEETTEAFMRYAKANQDLQSELVSLKAQIANDSASMSADNLAQAHDDMIKKYETTKADQRLLQRKLTSGPDDTSADYEPVNKEEYAEFNDDDIIRATKSDKIKAGILFVIMLALTVTVAAWSTHLDEDSFIFSHIGLACVSPCNGNLETRDFFHGHNHFAKDEVIDLILHVDGNHLAAHNDHHYREHPIGVIVEIVGNETLQVKSRTVFSPVEYDRKTFDKKITADFDRLDEHHVINVYSTDEAFDLSFTLDAAVLTPLANYSEIIAALIMVFVYLFILIEVIHRTLVAIFGSMVAGMFFFAMHNGNTESIRQLMLKLEWSTLGLLFGMMLLVGELSHTGIFEWCSVRLLMASKGSFNRLISLLCVLTAVASAFLDNVTTMLLIAPVTIDMCSILDVDPRPYLIGEVILSNIGGTATLIGDPPNIIIGSSFDEIGFVDFIIHVLPAIFILCVPVSLALLLWIYRPYLSAKEMKALDTDKLKAAYPIYDEPRLLIAGTATFFVILMFFLHPVHHKDTAWIALLGAFITITFTNPHDVQDALRNHVEWDTLLFFAGLFVLVELCAEMGLLQAIGDALASYIEEQPEGKQTSIAITLIVWVSAITSAFLDNIPYTATMIPVIEILAESLPTVPLETLAWALSFGACLGGNGTLLGASANIVTAGIATNKGFEISFLNFFYPGMIIMIVTVALANLYLLVRYSWL